MTAPLIASAAVFVIAYAITRMWAPHFPQHEWGNWRRWSFAEDDSKWILSKPMVRECQTCGRKQRERWWRQ